MPVSGQACSLRLTQQKVAADIRPAQESRSSRAPEITVGPLPQRRARSRYRPIRPLSPLRPGRRPALLPIRAPCRSSSGRTCLRATSRWDELPPWRTPLAGTRPCRRRLGRLPWTVYRPRSAPRRISGSMGAPRTRLCLGVRCSRWTRCTSEARDFPGPRCPRRNRATRPSCATPC